MYDLAHVLLLTKIQVINQQTKEKMWHACMHSQKIHARKYQFVCFPRAQEQPSNSPKIHSSNVHGFTHAHLLKCMLAHFIVDIPQILACTYQWTCKTRLQSWCLVGQYTYERVLTWGTLSMWLHKTTSARITSCQLLQIMSALPCIVVVPWEWLCSPTSQQPQSYSILCVLSTLRHP